MLLPEENDHEVEARVRLMLSEIRPTGEIYSEDEQHQPEMPYSAQLPRKIMNPTKRAREEMNRPSKKRRLETDTESLFQEEQSVISQLVNSTMPEESPLVASLKGTIRLAENALHIDHHMEFLFQVTKCITDFVKEKNNK